MGYTMKKRLYESVAGLWNVFNDVWANFYESELYALSDSMPDRIFQVINANGKKLSYEYFNFHIKYLCSTFFLESFI